jgi:hypothetical protein
LWITTDYDGPVDLSGPQGFQGAQGAAGAQGNQGAQGAQGPQGALPSALSGDVTGNPAQSVTVVGLYHNAITNATPPSPTYPILGWDGGAGWSPVQVRADAVPGTNAASNLQVNPVGGALGLATQFKDSFLWVFGNCNNAQAAAGTTMVLQAGGTPPLGRTAFHASVFIMSPGVALSGLSLYVSYVNPAGVTIYQYFYGIWGTSGGIVNNINLAVSQDLCTLPLLICPEIPIGNPIVIAITYSSGGPVWVSGYLEAIY